MAVDYPFGFGDRTAPQFLALAAAALPVVLLLSTMPTAGGAAEQRPIIAGNGSLCSGFDRDGGGGCLAIAQAQPELEGFEIATELASGVVFRRSLQVNGGTKTGNTIDPSKFGCGKNKPGKPYYSCVPPRRQGGPNPDKCGPLKRGNPCH